MTVFGCGLKLSQDSVYIYLACYDEESSRSPPTEPPVAVDLNPLHSSAPSIEPPTHHYQVLILRWQMHGLTLIIHMIMYGIPSVIALDG